MERTLHRIASYIVHIHIADFTETEVNIARELFAAGFIKFDETNNWYVLTDWH